MVRRLSLGFAMLFQQLVCLASHVFDPTLVNLRPAALEINMLLYSVLSDAFGLFDFHVCLFSLSFRSLASLCFQPLFGATDDFLVHSEHTQRIKVAIVLVGLKMSGGGS